MAKIAKFLLFLAIIEITLEKNCSEIEIDADYMQIAISNLQTEEEEYKGCITDLNNIEENLFCINESISGENPYLKTSLLHLYKQQISEIATLLQNTTNKLQKYTKKTKLDLALPEYNENIIQYLHILLSIVNLTLIITISTVHIYKKRQQNITTIQQNTINELSVRRLI